MTTKRSLLQEKLENFRVFLNEIASDEKKQLIDEYAGKSVDDLVKFAVTFKRKEAPSVAAKIVLALDADVHSIHRVQEYLVGFADILDVTV